MALSDKISRYYPGAQWSLLGDSYEGLEWFGPGEKPTEQELSALDFPFARDAKLEALAERRWRAETGGALVGNMPVKSAASSTAKITAAYVQAKANPAFTVNWKVDKAMFVTLDAATIIAIGDAVTSHVQTCFDHEMALTTQIMLAKDAKALDAIDIDAGWPA